MNTNLSILSEEDIQAIKEITTRFAQAVNAKDWASVAALYTEDAVFMPANMPRVEGREAILTWMQGFPPLQNFELVDEGIDGAGDLAYVFGSVVMTFAAEEGQESVKDIGKYVEIRRKQDDGSWLIAVDIFNSDAPA